MTGWKSKKTRSGKVVHFQPNKTVRNVSEVENISEIEDVDEAELEEFARRKAEESEPEIAQVIKPDQEVDHVVEVLGYDIEIPEGEDEWDVVDEFMKKNNLYTIIDANKINPDKIDYSFQHRVEQALVNFVGTTDNPRGSVYLTTDGDWIGGEEVFGYDEDHRPQIRKALTYAGYEIVDNDPNHNDSSSAMVTAMELSGIIRAAVRDTLNLDIYQPLSDAQRRAIEDIVLERGYQADDIIIDLNNKMKNVPEDRILRAVGVY